MNVEPTDLIGRLNAAIEAQHVELNTLEQSRLADIKAQGELIKSAQSLTTATSTQEDALTLSIERQNLAQSAFTSAVTERRDLLDAASRDVMTLAQVVAGLAAPIVSGDTTSVGG